MEDTFKTLLTRVTRIEKVKDTDRLFHVWAMGWVFISSGQADDNGNVIPPYKVGDVVVYLQPDSILDSKLIGIAFPEGMEGKIKPDSLESHRLRTIRIRRNLSEGLLLNPDNLIPHYPKLAAAKVGDDVKNILNVVKYEPPTSSTPRGMQSKPSSIKNSFFKEYIDIQNFKYYNELFKEGEMVYISCKRHGTSSRYAILPTTCNTLWKKVLRFFGFLPKTERCIGSRRVQVHLKPKNWKGYYDEDVYTRVAKEFDLFSKIDDNVEIFGEIIGSGIQGSYTYGCKPGQIKFECYDVMKDGKFLPYEEFKEYCDSRGIPRVPELYVGPYDAELADNLRKGDDPDQKIREGIVIKSYDESHNPYIGRKVLKYINDDYLTQKNLTEFH